MIGCWLSFGLGLRAWAEGRIAAFGEGFKVAAFF